MAKLMRKALANGETDTVSGRIMILPLGNRKLRAFVHGETLSHYASGRRICDLRPYMILRFRSYGRRDKRGDALMALQDLENKIGAAKAWQVIDSAPVINGDR